MKRLKIAFTTWFFAIAVCTISWANTGIAEDIPLHMHVTGITEAGAPELYRNHIILTFDASSPIRYVAAAFSHENYTKLHTFSLNKHGIYVLAYPFPEDKNILKYRIVKDGLWMPDPNNPNSTTDNRGIRISTINLPETKQFPDDSPIILHKENKVRFIYRGDPGKRIFVVGDFNNYDPFMNHMQEMEQGIYAATVRMRPGTHYYFFSVNGEKVIDPKNSSYAYDYEGSQVNKLHLR